MDRLKEQMAHIGLYVAALLKWMAVGALVGGVGGFVGAAFHLGVSYATAVRQAHPWILYLLPVGGVVIAGLYKLCRLEGKGTNAVIESVHFGKSVPTLLVPLIFVATVITHLLGGSAGREGAALQIGGGIGYRTGTLLRLGEKDLPLATLCGMSGVFAALFGTPLTATVFALEVISVGVLYYAGLLPCITASLTGYYIATVMGVEPTRFTVAMPALSWPTLGLVTALAVGCALVSILFCRGLHITERLAERWLKNSFLRAAAGGLIIVLATLALGTTDYNGAGMDVIQRAVEQGQADGWAWFLKLAFTAVTIGCGFKGGEVVPSFFVGATFGCAAGGLLGLPPSFAAAVGLVAVFCGAVNCPIASVILSVELFGAGGMAYFAAACAVSYLLSGYCGLYSSQTILYSKLRAEFINVHTKE
ncbi:MAG: chloride channel protein [Firmicutes bacterium CAG:176_59_8]|nr:MAG: chloride channel protein [Firmicutes bacterium CAG:176_59_8]